MIKVNILDYIFPPRCPICERVFRHGICPECRDEIVFVTKDFCMKCGKPVSSSEYEYCYDCKRKKHTFERCRSILSYRGKVRNAILKIKYENKKEYASVFGHEMSKELRDFIVRSDITVIIPIPLYKSRQRSRGFNQAEVIASAISKDLQIPMNTRILYRTKKTSPQKQLNDIDRKSNLKDAFEVRGRLYEGENILLVDDIYTTGSTLDSAALCLKKSCNCRVFAVTIATGG